MTGAQTPATTVVVARRVRPGREAEFVAWDRRIRAAAEAHAGYLGSEVQRPDDSHPGEWVTVYSFASAEQLDAWLRSPERSSLMDEVTDLIEGPVREQRVAALRTAPQPVTVVFSQRVAPERSETFESLHDDVVATLTAFPGFLGSDLFPPVPGVQDDHVIVASFAARRDLDRWLTSPERKEWLDRVESLVEGDRTMNVVGGFGGWFPPQPSRPEGPKRWKQSVAVFIALYPTTLTISIVRGWVAPDMHVVFSVLLGNVLGILALSYVLMPRVTHLLRNWLRS